MSVSTLMPVVYVALGSMLGGVSRYGLTLATTNILAFNIPYGTLLSNIAGCLLIGVLAGVGVNTGVLSAEMRLLLVTGFCGGFTTMSAFVYELGKFVQDKEYIYASGYFALTFVGVALAFLAGLFISEFLIRS